MLEVNAREGSLAQSQLEEARNKLQRTKTQLHAMTLRHSETLSRLDATKVGQDMGGRWRQSDAQQDKVPAKPSHTTAWVHAELMSK